MADCYYTLWLESKASVMLGSSTWETTCMLVMGDEVNAEANEKIVVIVMEKAVV